MPARGSTPKRRPIWVGKKQFSSMTAAAAYLSVKTGRTVWPSEVRRKIGINIGRWTVSETKPEPPLALCEAEKIMPGVGEYRKPLLRYTWGERPWERGIGRVWR